MKTFAFIVVFIFSILFQPVSFVEAQPLVVQNEDSNSQDTQDSFGVLMSDGCPSEGCPSDNSSFDDTQDYVEGETNIVQLQNSNAEAIEQTNSVAGEANSEGDSNGIKPGGLVPCNGPDCDTCSLLVLGNTLLGWLIGVLMVIFSIIIALAGFGLVTSGGNVQAKSDAKNKMVNAIVGLIIVLAAWLIVDTLIKALVPEGNISNGLPWNEIQCIGQNAPEENTTSLGATQVNEAGLVVPEGFTCKQGSWSLDSMKCTPEEQADGCTSSPKPGDDLMLIKCTKNP